MHAGVKLIGTTLFASRDVERYERERFYAAADEHMGWIMEADALPSAEHLLASFVEYSCGEMDVRLAEPSPIINRSSTVVECLIPYEGDPSWFWLSARTCPPVTPATGRVVTTRSGPALLLSAEVDHALSAWVPVALAAELARVRQNLEMLALVAEQIDRDFGHRAAFLSEHAKRIWAARAAAGNTTVRNR